MWTRILPGLLVYCGVAMAAVPDPSQLDIDIDMALPETNKRPVNKPVVSIDYTVGSKPNRLDQVQSHRLESGIKWQEHLHSLFFSVNSKLVLYGSDDAQLDAGEDVKLDLKLGQAYAQISRKALSFRLGYQTLIWGELDTASVTDVFSPWDYTEFAFANPEDARLGQAMLQLNYFSSRGKLDAVLIPVVEVTRPARNVRDTVADVFGTDIFVLQQHEPKPFSDIEWALRWKRSRGPSDYAFMVASVLDNDPNLRVSGLTAMGPIITAEFPRYEFLGFNANYAHSKILYQAEFAYRFGRTLLDAETDQMAMSAGFEYTSNSEHQLAFDIRYQHNREIIPMLKRDDAQIGGRWMKNFLNQTLSLSYYLSYGFSYGDQIHSFNANYKISDVWHFIFNLSIFQPDAESALSFTDDWDQASISLGVDF